MKTIFNLLSLSLVILVSACSSDAPSSGKLKDADPIILKSELKEILVQDNNFAIDLFKTTFQSSNESSIFISPLSVSTALNMTLNGAVGKTKSEMQTALRNADYTIDQINEYSKTLREALLKVDPSTQFSIANSIWYRNGFNVEPSFIDVNKVNYNAEVRSIDFSGADAASRINNWCANNTNQKITTIVDNIPSSTMMYLINATYFKGIWKYTFDKKSTNTETFYAEDELTQDIQMMSQKSAFYYASGDNSSYLELPYGNNAFSMVIILPHEDKTITDVVEKLNTSSWNAALSQLNPTEVNLHLPRFKFEASYGLHKQILPQMGMKEAFNSSLADFSDISKNGGLSISDVIHKTFIEVNEEGSEAAAVTKVGMELSSPGPGALPTNFIVNKPFLFVIKEKSTGVIIFIGKIGKIVQ